LAAICVPLMIWHGSGTGTYSALVVRSCYVRLRYYFSTFPLI
jgi:hypothetical protein